MKEVFKITNSDNTKRPIKLIIHNEYHGYQVPYQKLTNREALKQLIRKAIKTNSVVVRAAWIKNKHNMFRFI